MDVFNFSFNVFAIPQLITAVFSFILGFLVLYRNKKSEANIVYFVMSMSSVLWQLGYFFTYLSDNVATADFWQRVAYIGVPFLAPTMYHFSTVFLKFKKHILALTLSYMFAAVFAAFCFASDLIMIEPIKYPWGYHPHVNALSFSIFLMIWMIPVLLSIVNLYIGYKNGKTGEYIEAQRRKYLSLAFIIVFLAALDFIPMYGVRIYAWGYLPVITTLSLVAYTIIRYRLMDIKVVLRQSSIYIALLVTVILPAIFASSSVRRFSPVPDILVDLIILLIVVIIFPRLKKRFYHFANKYFFSSLYDPQEVIAGLSEKLKSTLDLTRIYYYISMTLESTFHPSTVTILIFNEKEKSYDVSFDAGHEKGYRRSFKEDRGFFTRVIQQGKAIVVEELKQEFNKAFTNTIEILDTYKVDILVPLNIKDKVVGLLALGAKESKEMYNDEDLGVLNVVGSQVAIAIENALLFEETKQFGLKLEGEVKKATAELVAANAQLKELDQAKSDFVSIASHQLRTPLTVVKGYISMLIEGSLGKLDKKKTDWLVKVYESNERLIRLVENLLNISRIESGKLQFTYREVRLEDMVASVVDELKSAAANKKLKLAYKKPKKALPMVRIDEEKMRQVALNLLDNAIKYTPKGKIEVSVCAEDGCVSFAVADNGVGIKPGDLPRLFKKFNRGEGSSAVNTEGTGLGLYVAREMVEAHKGRIWAESKGEGQGSRFCFTLPLATPPQS